MFWVKIFQRIKKFLFRFINLIVYAIVSSSTPKPTMLQHSRVVAKTKSSVLADISHAMFMLHRQMPDTLEWYLQ